MSRTATFLRWLATFIAFPIGSLLAVSTVGSVTGPLTAALGGLIVGAVLGFAQWLALRPSGLSPWWIAVTSGSLGVGTAVGVAVTGAGTTVAALAILGAFAGGAVGLAQGSFRAITGGTWADAAIWTVAMAGAWTIGWLITSRVIIDAERGYVTFGSSGAVVATLLTGLLVRRVILPRVEKATTSATHEMASR